MIEIDFIKTEKYKRSGEYEKLLWLIYMVCGQHEQQLYYADVREIIKNRNRLTYIASLPKDDIYELEAYKEIYTQVVYFTEKPLA